MFSCEIHEIFKSTYSEKHLPTDTSINKSQQETHTLLGKENETHLANLLRGQWVLLKNELLAFDSVT